uniref:Uncharacterized protein n=1 Tax=Cacopsylla melanoneura TaxID=428564 RepID=A0A8D8YY60_9HEMI
MTSKYKELLTSNYPFLLVTSCLTNETKTSFLFIPRLFFSYSSSSSSTYTYFTPPLQHYTKNCSAPFSLSPTSLPSSPFLLSFSYLRFRLLCFFLPLFICLSF